MDAELVFQKPVARTIFTWRNGVLDIDIYNCLGINVVMPEHITGICLAGDDLDALILFLIEKRLTQ